MSYVRAIYFDFQFCCRDFIRGVEYLEQCVIDEAANCFLQASLRTDESDAYYYKYQSYYGLASLLSGDLEAIHICRKAASIAPVDADVALNLVRAEAFRENRSEALRVLTKALKFHSRHEGLLAMQQKLGVRGRKVLPILPRNNSVNVVLGKWLRRKNSIGWFFNML